MTAIRMGEFITLGLDRLPLYFLYSFLNGERQLVPSDGVEIDRSAVDIVVIRLSLLG